jgi:CheY-like chemotaxis protein
MPPLTVLIEDEILILTSLKECLKVEDFEVIAPTPGLNGLKPAAGSFSDLLLCNLRLPQTDGFEVLASLKPNPLTTPDLVGTLILIRNYLPLPTTRVRGLEEIQGCPNSYPNSQSFLDRSLII